MKILSQKHYSTNSMLGPKLCTNDLIVERSWAICATTKDSDQQSQQRPVQISEQRRRTIKQPTARPRRSLHLYQSTYHPTSQYTTCPTEVEKVAWWPKKKLAARGEVVVDVHCHYEGFARGRSHPGQAENDHHNDEEHGSRGSGVHNASAGAWCGVSKVRLLKMYRKQD